MRGGGEHTRRIGVTPECLARLEAIVRHREGHQGRRTSVAEEIEALVEREHRACEAREGRGEGR